MDIARDTPSFILLQPHGPAQQVTQALGLFGDFDTRRVEIADLGREPVGHLTDRLAQSGQFTWTAGIDRLRVVALGDGRRLTGQSPDGARDDIAEECRE